MKIMEIKKRIEELKNNMNNVSIDLVIDYSGCTMYICDSITEAADGNVSIYYSDIMKFISENPEAVDDAINKFGWDGCGASLENAGRMAEFLQTENTLYSDLEYIVELAALAYIQDAGYETIADDAYTVIMEELATINNNNRWDDIIDAIDKHCAIPAM